MTRFISIAMSAVFALVLSSIPVSNLFAQSEYGTILSSQLEYWNCVQQHCDPILQEDEKKGDEEEGEKEEADKASQAAQEEYDACISACDKKTIKRVKVEEDNLQTSSSWMMRRPATGIGGGPGGPTPPQDDPCAITGGFNTGLFDGDEPPTGGVTPICVPRDELAASFFGVGNLQGNFDALVFFDLRTPYGELIAETTFVEESGGGMLFEFEDDFDYEGFAMLTYYPEGNQEAGISVLLNLY